MAKDAYYFSHDSNAKDDPKCVMLIEQLGLEGYGIYWVLIEMLRDQPEYKYPLSLIPAISRRYNTTSEKMKTVIGNYGLFTVDDNDFFSLALMKRMEFYEYKKEISRAAGRKSAQVRALKASSTDVQPTFNSGSTSKVKNSTVDVIKEENIKAVETVDRFEDFWKLYPKKLGKTAALKTWNTLIKNRTSPDDLITASKNYATARKGQEEKFTLQASTFLGPQKRFEDFIKGGTGSDGPNEVNKGNPWDNDPYCIAHSQAE